MSFKINIKWVGDTVSVRPESVTVVPIIDGTDKSPVNLTNKNNYTVDVSGTSFFTSTATAKVTSSHPTYTISVKDSTTGSWPDTGFITEITMTYKGEPPKPKKQVSIRAEFLGDELDTGFRPKSITVSLMKDGVKDKNKVLEPANNWSHTWKDLDNKYNWTVKAPKIDKYSLDLVDNGNGNFVARYTYNFVPIKKKVTAKIKFVNDDQYLDLRPIYISLALEAEGKLGFLYEVGAGWNWEWNWGEQVRPEKCLVHFEEIPNYKLTVQKKEDVDIQFVGTYTCTYVAPPKPDPTPGNHPNKKDYDLMYSVLYDDLSAENAIDIIHILNYGDHGTSIIE